MKNFLLDIDFEETAQRIAAEVNGAAPDLKAEKAELVSVSTKIKNGMAAILGGMHFPELEDEIDFEDLIDEDHHEGNDDELDDDTYAVRNRVPEQ